MRPVPADFDATEADTCRRLITPKLVAAGWDEDPHSIAEQRTFTAGRIVLVGNRPQRLKQRRADYLLRYTRDFALAVVEAKPEQLRAGEGMQQAKEYAEMLGLKFAYASNGEEIIEFDYFSGVERTISGFPSPAELWRRYREGSSLRNDAAAEKLLSPFEHSGGKPPRYYQETAINRVVQAVLQGKRRVLVVMATGTGKTPVAFQICWKLWNAGWNAKADSRKPRILYLADRNILVDDPKDKHFALFGDARWKIENAGALKSREIYFSTYQSIARDELRPGLYREYARDFFDLVIVDECHRGSAREESNWREILEYFQPAYQLGLTATPLREDNRDTYEYFGNPIFVYSLRQGIEDGFLAPYRVHRVVTQWDAAGWRPSRGDLDRFGREIPDDEYQTRDFERAVALRARTQAVARHLSDFLKKTDRFAKTVVFCVDQEHADEMRRAVSNLNADVVREHPNYAVRVTAADGDIGRGHLGRFQELETVTPVVVTTSQLLTTGVDIQTCRNVALVRVINSMTEFKQIIGRGTRVREDYGKFFFNILDYTGSATRLFADPEFDGEPARIVEERVDENGQVLPGSEIVIEAEPPPGMQEAAAGATVLTTSRPTRPKYYFDGGQVEIAAHLVYELDAEGRQLRVVQLTDYTAERMRTLYRSPEELRADWVNPERRTDLLRRLEERGIDVQALADAAKQPEADPFDLLCHVAFNAPLRTRRERADRLRRDAKDLFDQYGPQARAVLGELLDKYCDHGVAQLTIPDALKVPPISERGNVAEIASFFGGTDRLREAVLKLQTQLYAA